MSSCQLAAVASQCLAFQVDYSSILPSLAQHKCAEQEAGASDMKAVYAAYLGPLSCQLSCSHPADRSSGPARGAMGYLNLINAFPTVAAMRSLCAGSSRRVLQQQALNSVCS